MDKPFVRVSFSLPQDLLDVLDEECREQQCSRSELLRELFRNHQESKRASRSQPSLAEKREALSILIPGLAERFHTDSIQAIEQFVNAIRHITMNVIERSDVRRQNSVEGSLAPWLDWRNGQRE